MGAVHAVNNARNLAIDTLVSIVLWFLIIVAFCWAVSFAYKAVEWIGTRWGTVSIYLAAFFTAFILTVILPAQQLPWAIKTVVLSRQAHF
jgi:hypothetical protein